MKMKEMKFAEFMLPILENSIYGGYIMKYVEMSVEEAMKKCKKNAKILVAIQDLADETVDIVFVQKKGSDYKDVFEDVKTVASLCDDFISQLKLFTEKQDIRDIRPYGIQRTVLLKEYNSQLE